MKDTTTDTIKNIVEQASETVNTITANTVNIWMLVAFAELIFIIFLLVKMTNRKCNLSDKEKFKRMILEGEPKFGDIIKSFFHAKPLYDELKKKCHPDLFPCDAEKNKIANEIFQEISKNERNYKKLLELKEQAKQQLDINI
ncbi:MAG: hypothetical protein LBC68_11470 [Prevotellaceae bacterium]|jgi:hypothetical protein|nr:hypothetical protein [Prevotellaceae bacterium]